jgi:hypothetical protein
MLLEDGEVRAGTKDGLVGCLLSHPTPSHQKLFTQQFLRVYANFMSFDDVMLRLGCIINLSLHPTHIEDDLPTVTFTSQNKPSFTSMTTKPPEVPFLPKPPQQKPAVPFLPKLPEKDTTFTSTSTSTSTPTTPPTSSHANTTTQPHNTTNSEGETTHTENHTNDFLSEITFDSSETNTEWNCYTKDYSHNSLSQLTDEESKENHTTDTSDEFDTFTENDKSTPSISSQYRRPPPPRPPRSKFHHNPSHTPSSKSHNRTSFYQFYPSSFGCFDGEASFTDPDYSPELDPISSPSSSLTLMEGDEFDVDILSENRNVFNNNSTLASPPPLPPRVSSPTTKPYSAPNKPARELVRNSSSSSSARQNFARNSPYNPSKGARHAIHIKQPSPTPLTKGTSGSLITRGERTAALTTLLQSEEILNTSPIPEREMLPPKGRSSLSHTTPLNLPKTPSPQTLHTSPLPPNAPTTNILLLPSPHSPLPSKSSPLPSNPSPLPSISSPLPSKSSPLPFQSPPILNNNNRSSSTDSATNPSSSQQESLSCSANNQLTSTSGFDSNKLHSSSPRSRSSSAHIFPHNILTTSNPLPAKSNFNDITTTPSSLSPTMTCLRLFFEIWIEKTKNITESDFDRNLNILLHQCNNDVCLYLSNSFQNFFCNFLKSKMSSLKPPESPCSSPRASPRRKKSLVNSSSFTSYADLVKKDSRTEATQTLCNPVTRALFLTPFSINSSSQNLLPQVIRLRNVNIPTLAKYITIRDHTIFCKIQSNELVGLAWMKDKVELAPNVKELISEFNRTALWISSSVIFETKMKKRVEALTCALELLEEMVLLRNWNGVQSVIAGLSHSSISRLRRTWAHVEKSKTEQYIKREELFSPLHNWISCRRLLKECERPALPYIGITLSDLVFIEEGNVNTFEEKGVTLINFQKYVLQTDTIEKLMEFKEITYDIDEQFLLAHDTLPTFEPKFPETALYDQSLVVEPRAKK